jgi:hypothetical protein
LLAKLDDSHTLVNKLKLDIVALSEQNKSLENKLKESKEHLKKIRLSQSLIRCCMIKSFTLINLDWVMLVLALIFAFYFL